MSDIKTQNCAVDDLNFSSILEVCGRERPDYFI